MESRFLGIPIVIWFLLAGIIALVDGPSFMEYNTMKDRLSTIDKRVQAVEKIQPISVSIPSATPSATPSASASVTPTMGFKKVFVSPVPSLSPTQ